MAITQIISTALLMSSLLGGTFHANLPDRSIHSPLFVVNKEYKLSEHYAPAITTISAYGVGREIREDLLDPLTHLLEVSKADGVDLHIVSGFRSYAKQNKVFSRKSGKVGTKKAADVVAIPGASEHQLGLAVDISYDNWMGINQNLENAKQGKWVRTKGYEHGFIVRYLREYEDVTGYSYEPWHIRYVGEAHSKRILELGEPPLEHYVSLLRAERFRGYDAPDIAWDYPIPLDKLLSICNDDPANIKKKWKRNKAEAAALEETVQKALKELAEDAAQNGVTLRLPNHKSTALAKGTPGTVSIQAEGRGAQSYLQDNAYIYGFLQQGSSYRYVGFDIAQYLYLHRMSYEDFSEEWKSAYRDFLSKGGKVSLSLLKKEKAK